MVAKIVFEYWFCSKDSENRSQKGFDSSSAIFLEKNDAYHLKENHIDVQYHFVRDMVEQRKIFLDKVDILRNVVDSFTKFVSTRKFS